MAFPRDRRSPNPLRKQESPPRHLGNGIPVAFAVSSAWRPPFRGCMAWKVDPADPPTRTSKRPGVQTRAAFGVAILEVSATGTVAERWACQLALNGLLKGKRQTYHRSIGIRIPANRVTDERMITFSAPMRFSDDRFDLGTVTDIERERSREKNAMNIRNIDDRWSAGISGGCARGKGAGHADRLEHLRNDLPRGGCSKDSQSACSESITRPVSAPEGRSLSRGGFPRQTHVRIDLTRHCQPAHGGAGIQHDDIVPRAGRIRLCSRSRAR